MTERDTLGYEAAREKLAGTMLLVDETSMVSSNEMLKLHQITAALGVDKLVLVGDRQQLSSIDAGKAFAMIQAGGGTMARMDQNIRQRTDQLRTVAALANIGKAGAALKVLGTVSSRRGAGRRCGRHVARALPWRTGGDRCLRFGPRRARRHQPAHPRWPDRGRERQGPGDPSHCL